MPLLKYTMNETPAISQVKGEVSDQMRASTAVAVSKFMADERQVMAIAEKLASSPVGLAKEMGKTAALIAEQAYQTASKQGIKLPQSAIWIGPSGKEGRAGAVFTAIDHLLSIVATMGLADEDSKATGELAIQAFEEAAQQAQQAPGIGLGARGMLTAIRRSQSGAPSAEGAKLAYRALSNTGQGGTDNGSY